MSLASRVMFAAFWLHPVSVWACDGAGERVQATGGRIEQVGHFPLPSLLRPGAQLLPFLLVFHCCRPPHCPKSHQPAAPAKRLHELGVRWQALSQLQKCVLHLCNDTQLWALCRSLSERAPDCFCAIGAPTLALSCRLLAECQGCEPLCEWHLAHLCQLPQPPPQADLRSLQLTEWVCDAVQQLLSIDDHSLVQPCVTHLFQGGRTLGQSFFICPLPGLLSRLHRHLLR